MHCFNEYSKLKINEEVKEKVKEMKEMKENEKAKKKVESNMKKEVYGALFSSYSIPVVF